MNRNNLINPLQFLSSQGQASAANQAANVGQFGTSQALTLQIGANALAAEVRLVLLTLTTPLWVVSVTQRKPQLCSICATAVTRVWRMALVRRLSITVA